MIKKIILSTLFFVTLHAREEDNAHIKQGNIALPTSQEPGPLFCFGQNIVDKGDIQAYIYETTLLGSHKNFTQVIPVALYGVTDELTITAGLPIAAQFKVGRTQSSGLGDFFIQGEYAWYNNDHPTYAQQATVVANMTFPTGSRHKNPPTTFDSPTFLLGATASHMDRDWYFFGCLGGILTTPHHSQKRANSLLYQGGIGRNLYYVPDKRIITLIIELFGSYTRDERIRGPHYKNFEDNNFFIGPSLWIATQRFIFNPGIAFATYGNTKNASRSSVIIAAQAIWKFN